MRASARVPDGLREGQPASAKVRARCGIDTCQASGVVVQSVAAFTKAEFLKVSVGAKNCVRPRAGSDGSSLTYREMALPASVFMRNVALRMGAFPENCVPGVSVFP